MVKQDGNDRVDRKYEGKKAESLQGKLTDTFPPKITQGTQLQLHRQFQKDISKRNFFRTFDST